MWIATLAYGAPLTLDESTRWLEARTVSLPGARLELHDGYVIPIRAGDVPAGFVYVGPAEATVSLANAGRAEALADPFQTELGLDGATVLRDLRWTEHPDVIVVLSRAT